MDEQMLRSILGEMLEPINNRLGRIENRMGALEGRMDRIEERMDRFEEQMGRFGVQLGQFEEQMGTIKGQINHFEKRMARMEETLYETKEICEAVRHGQEVFSAKIDGIDKQLEHVEGTQLRYGKRLDSYCDRIGAVGEELNLFHQSVL